MAFHRPYDNLQTVLAEAHSTGDGKLVVPRDFREDFQPTEDSPAFVTVAHQAAYGVGGQVIDRELMTIFSVVGRSNDSLLIEVPPGQEDQSFPAGSRLIGYLVSQHLQELQEAIESGDVGQSSSYRLGCFGIPASGPAKPYLQVASDIPNAVVTIRVSEGSLKVSLDHSWDQETWNPIVTETEVSSSEPVVIATESTIPGGSWVRVSYQGIQGGKDPFVRVSRSES